jgi:transporter family-2 protein
VVLGLLLALVAGAFIGLQNIFNRHLNVHVSGWAATSFVLLTGSFASLIFGLIFEGMNLFNFSGMQPSYWFFGLVGIGVIFCMMMGMKKLGPTKAVIISVIAQLSCSLFFDAIGFLSLPQVDLTWKDIVGLLLMFVGIYVFSFEKKTA